MNEHAEFSLLNDPVYMSQLATTEKFAQQTSAKKKSDNRTRLHEQSAALNGIFG